MATAGSQGAWALFATLILLPASLSAADLGAVAVQLPPYESYKGIERYAPTPRAYREAAADKRFLLERISYRSDGLNVFAYLYRPNPAPRGKKLPVIIFNRGSYIRDDFSPEVLMPAHRLAQHGFVVIAPMLRGSGGAPGRDEMGGADVRDIFNLLPVIETLAYADVGRLFLYGESRGAIMSMIAARDGFPAKAIAVYGLTTDLGWRVGPGGPDREIAARIWPDFTANEAAIVERRSPVRWPERINAPVLLMNGGEDDGVPPEQAFALASALGKLGKPYELKIFYGEGHVLGGRAAERDEDAVRWFRRFDSPGR